MKLNHNLTILYIGQHTNAQSAVHSPCSASNIIVAARMPLTLLAVAIGTSPGSKEISSFRVINGFSLMCGF